MSCTPVLLYTPMVTEVLLDGVNDLGMLSSTLARVLQIVSDMVLMVLLDERVLAIDHSVSGESVLFCCFSCTNCLDFERDNLIRLELSIFD